MILALLVSTGLIVTMSATIEAVVVRIVSQAGPAVGDAATFPFLFV